VSLKIKRGLIKSVLVTAGPTRERIDPVRFISNYSTGTFGYEIAREARARGCAVTLVSGPAHLKPPAGVKFVAVETAEEMKRAVLKNKADCVIMAAAVCDWRIKNPSDTKIKKDGKKRLLELAENPDILKELGRKKRGVLVGFALETGELEKNALKKLKEKNLDIIVANRLGKEKKLFGSNAIDIFILDHKGEREYHRNKDKAELAKIILDKVLNVNI